jgi:hypothetical protein
MADFAPPYDIAVHPKYRDTDFDDLPKWLQNRIERYSVKTEDVEEEPAETPEEPEQESDEDLDESGDPMPVDVEFPFHKGGGYYVLSDGKIVRGREEADEAQGAL